MSWKKLVGLAATFAVVGVVGFAGNGCSSSTSNSSGGGDAGEGGVVVHRDSGGGSGSGGSSSSSGSSSGGEGGSSGGSYDGTTGKQCTTDADCHSATGPGINKCSVDGFYTVGQLYPTPICLIPPAQAGNCNPGTDGNIHYCDGPDDPSSPGICLMTGGTATAPTGNCYAQCTFKGDGSAASGCVGKDVCNLVGYGLDTTATPPAVTGVGVCFGGCDADSDCASGQKCETYTGLCVTAPKTPAGTPGTGCKYDPSTGASTPDCNCFASSSNDLGYCTLFCRVGGSECPTGWTCEAGEPTTIGDAGVGFTAQNTGLAGSCVPKCTSADSGSEFGDAGQCPPNSSCQDSTAGGPDCLLGP